VVDTDDAEPENYGVQHPRSWTVKILLTVLSLLAAFVLVQSCSKDLSDTGGGKGAAVKREITIVFTLPGDDFASPEDLDRRNAVAAAIAEGGHGEVMSTGSGMGSMKIVVRTKRDEEISAIKSIMRKLYPEARYRIED